MLQALNWIPSPLKLRNIFTHPQRSSTKAFRKSLFLKAILIWSSAIPPLAADLFTIPIIGISQNFLFIIILLRSRLTQYAKAALSRSLSRIIFSTRMIVQRARISPIMRIFSVPFVSPIPHSRKTPSRKSRRISSSFKERMSMKRQNVHGLRSMKEDDIRRDFREGVFLECGIGETNGTEKMRMIGDMRARCTIMRVEKIIRDHERDNAAFAYCVKRLRNKIIMNRKF